MKLIRPGHSIRRRLLLTFTSITLVGSILMFVSAGIQLQQMTLDYYKRDLATQTLTAASTLTQYPSEMDDENRLIPGASLQLTISGLSTGNQQQLSMVDSSMRIMAISPPDNARLFQRITPTPEITSAFIGNLKQVMRTNAQGDLYVYTAAPIRVDAEGVRAVLQIAAPLEPAYDQARAGWMRLAIAGLPIIILNIIACLWVGKSFSDPVRELHQSALRIASGALDERIEVRGTDELGQLGAAFNTMVESLNTVFAAQRTFVSNAAHELRAPMMSLELRIEALGDSTLPASQRDLYLAECAAEVRRMAELVTSLLTLARIDEGRHLRPTEPYDAAALLQDTAHFWRIQATKVGLTFDAQLPDCLPELPVHPTDLRIMIDNLIGNAVKYSPNGGSVRWKVTETGSVIQIAVTDEGIGFTPDQADRLFDRFYRLPQPAGSAISGTGLGLAIVHSMAVMYGGSVTAKSPGLNRGSTFKITLPLAR